MAGEGMQRLNTASSFQGDGDPNLIKVSYQTGAKFEGSVKDHKRIGRGTFIWPNGSKYDGDFADNLRHGKGTQVWSDGSSYTGDFNDDLRHGEGNIQWSNGETYEGTFFKDRRHGKGMYKWPDGSSYTGTFYMDKKEGYGRFSFASGDVFEGLYKEDEREGPGVVTYKNGQQDVGLWRGEKLIKLCTDIKKAFTIKSHSEFEYNPEEHATYLDMADENQHLAPVENVLHPPPALDYPPKPDLTQRINELYSEALDPRSLAVDRQTFDREFFKNMPKNPNSQNKVKAWNATPGMVALQKHTIKHFVGKSGIKLDVDAVTRLDRSKFKEKGPLETQSEELIEAAGAGDASKVEALLNSRKVHPDVSDCHGHTALIGATVNWHIDVINVLLNQGANVNKLSDEGCSALAAGTIFYYPIEGFLYNIAERYMNPPPDFTSTADSKDSMPKSILANNKERRASRLNQINRIKSEISITSLSQTGPKSVSVAGKSSKSEQPMILRTRPSGNLESVEEALKNLPANGKNDEDADSAYDDFEGRMGEFGDDDEEGPEDFESNQSLRNYHIEVTDQLVERCATQLSHNELVVSREPSDVSEMGKARRLAIQMSHHERMKETLDLLLRRGADPNASSVPMPVLFFAIKSADVEMVKLLLMKGADTNTKLNKEKGGLYPIHIACAIPGEEGVQITELLLDALADPDARAEEDDSFLNHFLEEEWSKDAISEESKALLGGRTALQIACARDDNYKNACRVVRLLLEHKADSNLMCNGFSPLALAITSGNDLAIDELLLFGADPSLPLTHGVGSALCAATSTEYEHRRTIQGRVQLVDKLIKAGANVLAPIPIGPKRIVGTAVDYAYYMFNQDRRIAHMPYHALTHAERETYNARRKLLAHIGDIMRNKAVEREKRRNVDEEKVGMRSQSPSANFVYIGAGAKLPPGYKVKGAGKAGQSQVKFESDKEEQEMKLALESTRAPSPTRKPLFKYCYECGRSVGVRLAACTRCKEVYYCSKACKLKAWNARHKEECIRVGGRSRSPSPKNRAASPTAATIANRDKNLVGSQRINVSSSDIASQDLVFDGDKAQNVTENSSSTKRRQKEKLENQDVMDGTKQRQPHKQGSSKTASRQRYPSTKGSFAISKAAKHQGSSSLMKGQDGIRRSGRHGGYRSLHDETEDSTTRHQQRNFTRNQAFMGNLPHNYDEKGKKRISAKASQLAMEDMTRSQPIKMNYAYGKGRQGRLPPISQSQKLFDTRVPLKGLSRSAEGERKLAKHKFRTGSPPNYEYVYIDNYSHN